MAATLESTFRGVTEDLPARINLAEHISPERFALEKERIWKRSWLAGGRAHCCIS